MLLCKKNHDFFASQGKNGTFLGNCLKTSIFSSQEGGKIKLFFKFFYWVVWRVAFNLSKILEFLRSWQSVEFKVLSVWRKNSCANHRFSMETSWALGVWRGVGKGGGSYWDFGHFVEIVITPKKTKKKKKIFFSFFLNNRSWKKSVNDPGNSLYFFVYGEVTNLI